MVEYLRKTRKLNRELIEDAVQEVLTDLHIRGPQENGYVRASLHNAANRILYRERKQIDIAEKLQNTPPDHIGLVVCKQGHIKTEESTYRDIEGHLCCLICRRLQNRKSEERFKRNHPSQKPHKSGHTSA